MRKTNKRICRPVGSERFSGTVRYPQFVARVVDVRTSAGQSTDANAALYVALEGIPPRMQLTASKASAVATSAPRHAGPSA